MAEIFFKALCITHYQSNHKHVTRGGIRWHFISGNHEGNCNNRFAIQCHLIMNVIHQLESDSSSDCDGFVNKDCDDDDHQENESDIRSHN